MTSPPLRGTRERHVVNPQPTGSSQRACLLGAVITGSGFPAPRRQLCPGRVAGKSCASVLWHNQTASFTSEGGGVWALQHLIDCSIPG